jgi:hypothetical protein
MVAEQVQSELPNLADMPLRELGTSADPVLRAGVQRLLRRIDRRDERIGTTKQRG